MIKYQLDKTLGENMQKFVRKVIECNSLKSLAYAKSKTLVRAQNHQKFNHVFSIKIYLQLIKFFV